MADKIRWGIMSTANIARGRFVPAVAASEHGMVAAVASRSIDKARQLARDFDIPSAYGSYQELLDDPNVNAVYIALPNSEHADWSIRCAEAGKPALCEKPLASNAAQARLAVDAFASRGLVFAEGFMYRFHPQTERVKALVDAGQLGDVKVISAAFTFVGREDEIAMNKALAGGSLMDVGCYCVNVMRYMLGEEPEHVSATALWGEQTGVDETFVGTLVFPSGAVGHFDSGLRAHQTHAYEIRGTRGRIAVDPGFDIDPLQDTVIRCWSEAGYTAIQIAAANHFVTMADDFALALLEGRRPRFSAEDGVHNMRVIDRLFAAATEN
jgi:D-xylose 1-dehydrogenase (NADP+, D-xylono-1,5-lactone-forming)